MNILKNTMIPSILAATILLPMNNAFANNALEVSVGSATTANITNLSAEMIGNTVSVSGKMRRSKQGHVVFTSGKINVELFNKQGDLLKTVNLNPRRHRHHVNKPYTFSSKIDMAAHNVSKVVVTYK